MGRLMVRRKLRLDADEGKGERVQAKDQISLVSITPLLWKPPKKLKCIDLLLEGASSDRDVYWPSNRLQSILTY